MRSTDSPNQMKVLKTIHAALIMGPGVFALVVVYILTGSGEAVWMDDENAMIYFPIAWAILAIPLSTFLFNHNLKESLNNKETLSDKLAAYQTANIVRMGLLESTALFSLVICFVTYTFVNLITFAIAFSLMILSFPSAFGVAEKLKLSKEDREQLTLD